MGLRHNKDPEVILGSLIIVHHEGATHRLTQQAIFKTLFQPRMTASTIKKLQREHCTDLVDISHLLNFS